MALMQIDHGTKEYRQMLDLRYEVLRKPLGLNFADHELEKEKNDLLIVAIDSGTMLGCCILTIIDKERIRLRQMAVNSKFQRKGIGDALMHFAENLARDQGFTRLVMHARKTAVGFYEQSGYKINGNEFVEITLPHYLMEKKLL